MELHSALVHFPIALLVFAAVFEILGRATKREALRSSAHHLVISAALVGLATVGSGLLAAREVHDPKLAKTLSLHRLLGFGIVGLAIVLSAWRMSAKKGLAGAASRIYLLLLIAGTGLAMGTGWLGGQIAHSEHSHGEHEEHHSEVAQPARPGAPGSAVRPSAAPLVHSHDHSDEASHETHGDVDAH